MSKDAAITTALALAGTSAPSTTVVWASIESDPFVRDPTNVGPLVWIVRLAGGLTAPPCPPGFLDAPPTRSSAACLDSEGGVNVVLDYFSGELVGWVH
jgi:hypothetical protein